MARIEEFLQGEEISAIYDGSLISASLGAKAYLIVGKCWLRLILWCIKGLWNLWGIFAMAEFSVDGGCGLRSRRSSPIVAYWFLCRFALGS